MRYRELCAFVTASCHNDQEDRRPEAEVELEAGTLDYHELESDVNSQQGCYSPVSSVSDMEPSAEHGEQLSCVLSSVPRFREQIDRSCVLKL